MQAQGTLSPVDASALENHCRLHALVARMEGEVAALPALTFVEHDVPKVHPLVPQLRAGRMALRASMQELGLSPASRTRVNKTSAPTVDPLARFTARRRG